MTTYASSGTLASNYLTLKAGATLPIKVTKIEVSASSISTFGVYMYTGGGTITGGSTLTPFPLREGGPAAGATSKLAATAISGTQRVFANQTVAANTFTSYSFPFSVVLSAGSATVMTVFLSAGQVMVYFDELEVLPGY